MKGTIYFHLKRKYSGIRSILGSRADNSVRKLLNLFPVGFCVSWSLSEEWSQVKLFYSGPVNPSPIGGSDLSSQKDILFVACLYNCLVAHHSGQKIIRQIASDPKLYISCLGRWLCQNMLFYVLSQIILTIRFIWSSRFCSNLVIVLVFLKSLLEGFQQALQTTATVVV